MSKQEQISDENVKRLKSTEDIDLSKFIEDRVIPIDKGNILIADFMGYYLLAGHFYSKESGRGKWFKTPRYHNSWDWLKPVVDRIFEYSLAYSEQSQWVCSAKIVVDITPCWENVVKFITWYNSITK